MPDWTARVAVASKRWPADVPLATSLALALGVIAFALFVRWLLDPVLDLHVPFMMVYAALLPLVLLVRPSAFVIAALLGLLASWYLFAQPRYSFFIPDEDLATQMALIVLAVTVAGAAAFISSRTQQRIRLAEERLRLAKEAARIGIHSYDVASGRVEWDERSSEFWGTDPDEPMTYERWIEGVHPDDRGHAEAAFKKALNSRGAGRYFAQYRVINSKTGEMRWIEAIGQVTFSRGEPIGLIGTTQDITERKRLEDAIAHHAHELAAALEDRTTELTETHEALRRTEAMAVLGTLSSGIAHDINNLLFPMEARLQALQGMDLPANAREHINGIAKNIQYISDLAKRLRKSIAPPGTNRHGAEPLHLARWCEDSESFFRSVVSSPIELECDVPRDLPLITLNRIGLTQAVYNLVQNSAKEMRKSNTGSRIFLRAATEHNANGEHLTITVEDDGPGMSAETRKRCTDPRFTTAAEPHAMGLGMTLVKAFTESSGGTMHIDSPSPGKDRGTTITLRFPIQEPAPTIHTHIHERESILKSENR